MTKKVSLLISLFLGILFLTNPSPTLAISWTKYPHNPVLDLGEPESWEDMHVSAPAVLFDGTIYKMWYSGHDGANWHIGYATSPDGKNWTKYEGNPVLEPNPELDGQEIHVTEPTVIFDGGNYKMWFTSEREHGCRWRIGYATSSNGIHWDHSVDFVLTASEDWETDGVATPFVLKDGDLYKMWYAARAHGIWKIGYASSDNGIVWLKNSSNPVLYSTQPSWEYTIVGHPSVILSDSSYYLWYSAGPIVPYNIGYAISSDGIDWTNKPFPPENPALQRGTDGSFDDSLIVAPSVIKRDDVYQMWYGGNDGSNWRIGYAATGEIPPPKPSIVILPGFGASWNHQKIFFGQEVPQSDWKMTPFVKHYDNLIDTLDSADYTKDTDLFVFNYDWTKPIDQIAGDLAQYVDEVVDPPAGESSGKKVKLIGHSLGGLVARAYIQNNLASHQVDQLITLGSPHKGVVQVYQVWEGADLHDLLHEPLRLGAELILALRWRGYKNKVEAIRNTVPSLKDLLFTEDYLKNYSKGKIIPETSYSQQNTWLKNLGISQELKNLLDTVVGKTGDTLRWFKVVSRSKLDKMLGRWEDGKPTCKEFEIGDKTILASSAGPEETAITEVTLDHSDLIRTEEGINTILTLLGLDGFLPVVNPYPPDTPYLVFALASPGNLRITNPLAQMVGFDISPSTIPHALYLTEEKMVVIPGAIDGDYQVEVVSDGESGSYRLLIGQLTEKKDIWQEYQGEISPDQTDTYTIKVNEDLKTSPLSLAYLIESRLKKLLEEAIKSPLSLRKKLTINGLIVKTLAEFEPSIALLKAEKNKAGQKLVGKALNDALKLKDYLERQKESNLLDKAKEIIDLLDQLDQLLSN